MLPDYQALRTWEQLDWGGVGTCCKLEKMLRPMTLLVVEDEYLILDFVCAEMADADIAAIGATTADEAVRILQTNPAITALVTDINMPGRWTA